MHCRQRRGVSHLRAARTPFAAVTEVIVVRADYNDFVLRVGSEPSMPTTLAEGDGDEMTSG